MVRASYVFNLNNLIMLNLDISSKKGASTLTYVLYLSLIISLCTGKIEAAISRNLKVKSLLFMSHSNSTKCLTPNIKSTLLYISETIV